MLQVYPAGLLELCMWIVSIGILQMVEYVLLEHIEHYGISTVILDKLIGVSVSDPPLVTLL